MPQAGPLLEAPIQLSKLLQIGVNDRPHEAALVSMEGVWSWSKLEETTNRLAAQYLALGLQPGDRVASLMPNAPRCSPITSPASRPGW